MFGFIVSFLFGAAQMYATIRLIPIYSSGDKKGSRTILAAKFFAYLGAVALVTLKFLSLLTYCLCCGNSSVGNCILCIQDIFYKINYKFNLLTLI